jgi:hypothetical protein
MWDRHSAQPLPPWMPPNEGDDGEDEEVREEDGGAGAGLDAGGGWE